MSVDPGIELGLTVLVRVRVRSRVKVRVRARVRARVRSSARLQGGIVAQGFETSLGLGLGFEIGSSAWMRVRVWVEVGLGGRSPPMCLSEVGHPSHTRHLRLGLGVRLRLRLRGLGWKGGGVGPGVTTLDKKA